MPWHTKKSDFCNFRKRHKRASQKEKTEAIKQNNKQSRRNELMGSNGFEKHKDKWIDQKEANESKDFSKL